MKIENHVVSLELAKQLKEAGYPQDETYFCWDLETATIWQFVERTENYIAAPLASELGEQLSHEIWHYGYFINALGEHSQDNVWCTIRYQKMSTGEWWVSIIDRVDISQCTVCDKNEADARAKMWLYLKKVGLLPPPQSGEKE